MIIKVLKGHLTQTEKSAIKQILEANQLTGRTTKKQYLLIPEEDGIYEVKVQQRDRGIMPTYGEKLRTTIRTYKIQVK